MAWSSMGEWQETHREEHIDLVLVAHKGNGQAEGLQARQVFFRNLVNVRMENARERIIRREAGDGKSKTKVLAEGKDGNYDYSLFTLEVSGTKHPQLWYLYQGERGLYANAILFSGKPSKSDLTTWSEFLQLGELQTKEAPRRR